MAKHEIWVVMQTSDDANPVVMARLSRTEDPELFERVLERAREERVKRPWGAPPRDGVSD